MTEALTPASGTNAPTVNKDAQKPTNALNAVAPTSIAMEIVFQKELSAAQLALMFAVTDVFQLVSFAARVVFHLTKTANAHAQKVKTDALMALAHHAASHSKPAHSSTVPVLPHKSAVFLIQLTCGARLPHPSSNAKPSQTAA